MLEARVLGTLVLSPKPACVSTRFEHRYDYGCFISLDLSKGNKMHLIFRAEVLNDIALFSFLALLLTFHVSHRSMKQTKEDSSLKEQGLSTRQHNLITLSLHSSFSKIILKLSFMLFSATVCY